MRSDEEQAQSAQGRVLVIGKSATAKVITERLARFGLLARHVPAVPPDGIESYRAVDLVLLAPSSGSSPPCAAIKLAQTRFMPVMVVLSKRASTSRTEILQAGADDVLTGLPEDEELQLRVFNWIRIKQTHDSLLSARHDVTEPTRTETKTSYTSATAARSQLEPLVMLSRPASPSSRITLHGLTETRLRSEYDRALRLKEALAFAYFSVDDAKHMLHRFGNKTTDKIARKISSRMQGCFRGRDQVYHIDTLGFAAVLPGAHFEGALAVTTRTHKRVTGIYDIEGTPMRVSLSVGVSLFPSPSIASYRDLGTIAQLGAGEAFAAGGNRICIVQHPGYLFEPAS